MAIINSYNRKRGVTYVYESISYWDKELKQPRSKRRLLGRRDPDTGELIATRKQNTASAVTPSEADSDTDYVELYRQNQKTIRDKDALILLLRKELANAKTQLKVQKRIIDKAVETLQGLEPEKESFHA